MIYTKIRQQNNRRYSFIYLAVTIVVLDFLSAIYFQSGEVGFVLFCSVILLIVSFYVSNILTEDLVLTYIFLNLLFGPFVNQFLVLDDLTAFYKYDGILGLVILPLLIVNHVQMIRFSLLLLSLSLCYFVLGNDPDVSQAVIISDFFQLLGILSISCFVAHYKISSIKVRKILLSIFFFHLVLSILQLFIPFNLRGNDLTTVYMIYRPTGFLEWSYTYGVTNAVLLWILRPEKIVTIGKQNSIILLVSAISTRSIALGFISWIVIRRHKWMGVVLLIALFAFIVFNFRLIDQSNQTKILLLLTMGYSFINSDFASILLGHGLLSSSTLINSSIFSGLVETGGYLYDNRIDGASSFPIHNVYAQVVYERGFICFLVFFGAMVSNLRGYMLETNSIILLFFLIFVTNYFLHNGFYSFIFYLTFFKLRW